MAGVEPGATNKKTSEHVKPTPAATQPAATQPAATLKVPDTELWKGVMTTSLGGDSGKALAFACKMSDAKNRHLAFLTIAEHATQQGRDAKAIFTGYLPKVSNSVIKSEIQSRINELSD